MTDSHFLRSPYFSTTSFATMATAWGFASMSRNQTNGSFKVNFTVYLSGASTLSTDLSMYALALPFTVRKWFTLNTTSSAVSSRPFTGGFACQRTPLRSLNTYVVSLGWVHDSARSPSIVNVPGATLGPALCRSSRLCVKLSAMCVLYEMVWNGSKCGGSQVRIARVPPRLGVWARATAGAIDAPASTVPPSLSRCRRLRVMESSATSCAGGDDRERLVEYVERFRDVLVGVGERHVDLVRGLDDAAPDQLLVEALDPVAIGRQGRAIVDDLAVGEEDVEDRRLAADLRGPTVLARGGGQTFAEPRAGLEEPRVHPGLPELGQGREAGRARDRVAVERSGLPDVVRGALERRVEVTHDRLRPGDARERK